MMVPVLDAQRLEGVVSGKVAPEDVPARVARLASLATTLHADTPLPSPSTTFRRRLREELLATDPAKAPRPRVPTTALAGRARLRRVGAAVAASALVGTTGVAAVAQSALPGDVLYSVKGATEQARIAFASSAPERGRLHLQFARVRLAEVTAGVDRLSTDQLGATLATFDQEASAGADALLLDPDAPSALDDLASFTSEVRARLLEVDPSLPFSVQSSARRTMDMLQQIDARVRDSAPSCAACTNLNEMTGRLADQVASAAGGVVGTEAPDAASERSDPATPMDASPTTVTSSPDPSVPPGRGGLDAAMSRLADLLGGDGKDGALDNAVGDVGAMVEDSLDGVGSTVEKGTDAVGDTVDDLGAALTDELSSP